MDLWEMTRLLFRRWYFALPILLLTIATSIFVGNSVKPDYRANGHVVMIPATGTVDKPGEKNTRPKNPWNDLGFEALGNAAILTVMDQKTLKSLKDAGLTDSITVQMDLRSPILLIEAVGTTPKQATETVRQIIKMLIAEVAQQQKRYGVYPEDTITTLTLTDGTDVETVTSKVKRVLIITIGLGLLLTTAGTIGLDVLVRWRRRRKADEAGAAATQIVPIDEEAGDRAPIRPRFMGPRLDGEGDSAVTARIPLRRAARSRVSTDRPAAEGTEYNAQRSGGRRAVATAMVPNDGEERDEPPNGRASVPPADATVVLPTARDRDLWSNQDRGGR